ncbi:MAG: hypothetical protein ACRDNT_09510 [Streptosporangiaceae bacterium]
MNGKTGGNRGLRRAGALAAVAAVAVLATACGSSAPSSASAPTYAQVLALAGCMRGHGVPDFPDPNASGGYSLASNGSLEGAGGSVDIDSSRAQAAYGDCRHLLPGGPSISQLEQQVQQEQQRQAKMLPLLLKYTQCMRSHGVPDFPGPGQGTAAPDSAPPNVNSPQYLAAASACQHLLPPGDKVSISTSQSRSPS